MIPQGAIAHYKITSKLGAGGMGEVWRATDTKLGREVAIKILPESVADDPERLARFAREARVLASLNHPNIAAIYGVEERALVMELVEGESPKGPMAFETAWKIAIEIAEALDYAHERGVVHRDLKPANVKVTPDGVVKLLDFGLAKALSDAPDTPSSDPVNSPTITIGATTVGTIMGTAAYMSPEQAKGKRVDKRADIWSWGVMLYELITGDRMFKGEDAADTLAQVLTKEPDLDRVPARVRLLLGECLQKDAKLRLRDIGDAKRLLEDGGPRPARGFSLAWIATGIALLIAGAALGFAWWRSGRAVEQPFMQLNVDLGPDAIAGQRTTVAISRDGRRIVFPTKNGLATRRLDEANSTPLTGTAGAEDPFFSPDGKSIGFFAEGKLKRIAIEGGAPVVLAGADTDRGGSWGEDGNIIYQPLSRSGSALLRVPADGGRPSRVAESELATTIRWPQVLPGVAAVLFTAGAQVGFDTAAINALSLKTGQQKVLVRGGYFGRFFRASPSPGGAGGKGFLLYVRGGTIFGAPFDPSRLELLAPARPLIQGVAADSSTAGGQFDVAENGVLVYQSGRTAPGRTPAWMDPNGRILPWPVKPGFYSQPRFSPSGKRLAYPFTGPLGRNLFVYDIARDTPTQLTFDNFDSAWTVWTPDEAHLVYSIQRSDSQGLWLVRADGSVPPQLLLQAKNSLQPGSFTPDGRRLIYVDNAAEIRALPLDLADPEHPKPGQPERIPTKSQAADPAASPDGHWLAYSSAEAGPRDVFVQPFPGSGARTRISTEGGRFPVWSRKAHELLFFGGDDRIMVVDYTIQGGNFEASKPRPWSPVRVVRNDPTPVFDLHPDGKRLVVFPKPEGDETRGGLRATFLLNFAQELSRRFGEGK